MITHIILLVVMGLMMLAVGPQTQITEIIADVEEPPEEVLTQVLDERAIIVTGRRSGRLLRCVVATRMFTACRSTP